MESWSSSDGTDKKRWRNINAEGKVGGYGGKLYIKGTIFKEPWFGKVGHFREQWWQNNIFLVVRLAYFCLWTNVKLSIIFSALCTLYGPSFTASHFPLGLLKPWPNIHIIETHHLFYSLSSNTWQQEPIPSVFGTFQFVSADMSPYHVKIQHTSLSCINMWYLKGTSGTSDTGIYTS